MLERVARPSAYRAGLGIVGCHLLLVRRREAFQHSQQHLIAFPIAVCACRIRHDRFRSQSIPRSRSRYVKYIKFGMVRQVDKIKADEAARLDATNDRPRPKAHCARLPGFRPRGPGLRRRGRASRRPPDQPWRRRPSGAGPFSSVPASPWRGSRSRTSAPPQRLHARSCRCARHRCPTPRRRNRGPGSSRWRCVR